jgi:hypothetical protein
MCWGAYQHLWIEIETGCTCVCPGHMGKLICPFEATIIRFDSCALRLHVNVLECISVSRRILVACVCIQDAWESSFVHLEVTMIRFDSYMLRLLVNISECISALMYEDGCWACVCASRTRGKAHLYIWK